MTDLFSINTLLPSAMDITALETEAADLRGRLISAGIDYQVRVGSLRASGVQASRVDTVWAARNRRFVGMAARRLGEVQAALEQREGAATVASMRRKIDGLVATVERQATEIAALQRHSHDALGTIAL